MNIGKMKGNLKYIHYRYMMLTLLAGFVANESSTQINEKACPEISSEECLKKLETFLRLKSLPFTSSESELNNLCMNTVGGYNCSAEKSSVPHCLSPADKALFPIFVDMAQTSMLMFCDDGSENKGYLRKDLLKKSECILKQKEALDCCAKQSELMDLPVIHVLEHSSKSIKDRQKAACCPVAYYLKCAVSTVEKNCGKDAGSLIMMYVRRSSGEPLEAVCQKMPGYPEPHSEICDYTPVPCSASRIGTLLQLIYLTCLVLIMRMGCI